jgi:hypothetical protein
VYQIVLSMYLYIYVCISISISIYPFFISVFLIFL